MMMCMNCGKQDVVDLRAHEAECPRQDIQVATDALLRRKCIPPSIAARWRPMWHPDAHPGRPWWRWLQAHNSNPDTGEFCAGACYVRVDAPGVVWVPALSQGPDGTLYDSTPLEAYDREHPLPPPPPMPGQVWIHEDGTGEVMLGSVSDEVASRNAPVPGSEWPPPGCILVAGPTPWGRDVPWMDTSR